MKPKLIFSLALVLAGGWLGFSSTGRCADESPAKPARAFVTECLHNTNVFVMNPPADANPYRDWSPAERRTRMEQAGRNGSRLYLYPNGLPQRFESRKRFKQDGLNKSWHHNGQMAADEYYENEKLVAGRYYDESGKLLNEVANGTGRQIIFDVQSPLAQGGISGVADWRDGLRDGVWIIYVDFAKGIKREEFHYLKGKLDGPNIWWRDGQKSTEQNYRNGLRDGPEVTWYSPGNTNRITFYREGNNAEHTLCFYSTGTNSEEIVNGTNGMALHRYWYPNGILMSEEIHDGGGITLRSYDLAGRPTGKVEAGNGLLVVPEFAREDQPESFFLHLFKDGKLVERHELPRLGLFLSADHANTALLIPQLLASEPAKSVTVELRLPEGVTSDSPLSFTFSVTNPADVLQLPPVELKFPLPFRDWTGDLPADLNVEVQGRLLHYQASAWRNNPRLEATRRQSLPVPTPDPIPRSVKEFLIYKPVGSDVFSTPKLAVGEAPPFRQAVDQWICGEELWVLYDRPTLLLRSANRGQDWQVVRKDFKYRPGGLACWSAQHLVVWGTRPIATPAHGLPFVIEESFDGGKHWQPIKGRLPIDYLLGVTMQAQVMSVIGIRLPKTGLPEGRDWFELPRTSLASEDGIFFTENAGSSIFEGEIVEKKSLAPDNTARAYILNTSFRGKSFDLYAARTSGEIPEYVASCWSRPDIVWSGNSRIVALQTNGVFMTYGDLESRPFAPVDFYGSPQDKDTKIQALLKANPGTVTRP